MALLDRLENLTESIGRRVEGLVGDVTDVQQTPGGPSWSRLIGGGAPSGGRDWSALLGGASRTGMEGWSGLLGGNVADRFGGPGLAGMPDPSRFFREADMRNAEGRAARQADEGPGLWDRLTGKKPAQGGGDVTGDVDQWIARTRPGSPLVGQGKAIADYARAKGVNPGLIMGLLRKESQLGSDDGEGTRQNNPGNIIDTGRDQGLGNRRFFLAYPTMLDGAKAMVDTLADPLYRGKSLEEQVAYYYVGPQAYAQHGLDANDAGGRGPGGNGTVRDYLNQHIYPVMQELGATAGAPRQPQGGAPMGTLWSIWGGTNIPITQEYGHTDYSTGEGAAVYDFGAEYGLDGDQHTGLDIGTVDGTRLYSPVAGTVIVAGGSGFYRDETGRHDPATSGELRIRLDNGHELILGHNSAVNVQRGQRVNPGDFVGLSGSANGDHLHVEYRIPDQRTASSWAIVDPRQYLR